MTRRSILGGLAACGGGGGEAGTTPSPTVQPQVAMVVSNTVATAAAPCTAWPAFSGSSTDCLPSPNLDITSATQTR